MTAPTITPLNCDDWAILKVGSYFAENDVWGKEGVTGYSQCIGLIDTPTGGAVRITFNWPDTPAAPNEVKGFPAIISGRKPGFGPRPDDPSWVSATPGTRLPIRVDELQVVNTRALLSGTDGITGKGHIAWDLWFQSNDVHTNSFASAAITNELMVQLQSIGGYAIPPNIGGTAHGTFVSQGYTFWVYRMPVGTWQFTRYIPQIPAGSSIQGDLSLLPFIQHANSQGWISDTEYLMSASLGYEPEYGTADFTIYEFSFVADERSPLPPESYVTAPVTLAGINVGTLMSAAQAEALGSQKTRYLTDLIAEIGSGATVHLLRTGAEVYRDNVTGSLTQSAGTLVLPNTLAEPPEVNTAADIDTGAWSLEVRNAASPSKKIVVPLGPSNTSGALWLDNDLDGTQVVRFNDVRLAAPASLDVGIGGGTGSILTPSDAVEGVISSMSGFNERPLRGITDVMGSSAYWWARSIDLMIAAGRTTHAGVVQGPRPRYDNMSSFWKGVYRDGRGETAARALQWVRILPWAIITPGGALNEPANTGHRATNTGVRFYPLQAWGLLPNGQWELVFTTGIGNPGRVRLYRMPGFWEDVGEVDSRAGPNGSVEMKIPPKDQLNDRALHPYGQSFFAVDELRYSAFFFAAVVHLIQWDPNLPDDRNIADLVTHVGGDWYTDPGTIWLQHTPYWPGIFTPRFRSITSTPQYFGGASLTTGVADNLGEGMISATQLRNNPPPIATWTD